MLKPDTSCKFDRCSGAAPGGWQGEQPPPVIFKKKEKEKEKQKREKIEKKKRKN